MKCEPSHHVVWHNMHRKTAIFQRPETTPPMPAYHTSPKTTEKRIVWQTERAIRAGRPSALVTIMFYGSTPAICRTSASALNNPSPVCVAMCADTSFRRALTNAKWAHTRKRAGPSFSSQT